MNAPATFLRRAQIEHIIRAVHGITGHATFVLIGTGAVIAQSRTLPLPLMVTRELDLYAQDAKETDQISTLIDATVGEGSMFDETFGYHAHGIGPTTATLPQGWRNRAKELTWPTMPGVVCICPDVDDIALSKICAWREKDIDWLRKAHQARLLNLAAIKNRVADLNPLDARMPAELERRIDTLTAGPVPP